MRAGRLGWGRPAESTMGALQRRPGLSLAGRTEIAELDVGLQRAQSDTSSSLAVELGNRTDTPGERSAQNAHFRSRFDPGKGCLRLFAHANEAHSGSGAS
jgi:hypothetical protein